MITLSYTTIDDLHKASHTWINKTLGIEKPTSEAMEKGRAAHEKIQAHVSGKEKIAGLDLSLDFPRIEYHAKRIHNDKFTLHGYCDGVNFAAKAILEIKTTGKKSGLWSQQDFERSMQPAYYSFVTGFPKAWFITCLFDLTNIKTYYREFTPDDWKRAEQWAKEGIDIIESGDYTGGLDDTGHCLGCSYSTNCYFL